MNFDQVFWALVGPLDDESAQLREAVISYLIGREGPVLFGTLLRAMVRLGFVVDDVCDVVIFLQEEGVCDPDTSAHVVLA